MELTKDITPKEYAKWAGCTVANISKKIRNGGYLVHVIRIKKWSRFYTLEVPKDLDAKSFIEW
jgi:hypothetical protein